MTKEIISADHVSIPVQAAKITPPGAWGRTSQVQWYNNLAALLVVFAPLGLYITWLALEQHGGSLLEAAWALCFQHSSRFKVLLPQLSCTATLGYAVWLVWQAALYYVLPSKQCFGSVTPGGQRLAYLTNGLMAWTITLLLFLAAAVVGVLDPAVIARSWDGLFLTANAYGFVLAGLALVKGYWAPSYPEDCKTSSSWIFDFWAGVELNPRLGQYFDLKFFHNGRPGIVAWTLIELSWAAYQRQSLGYVTNSMLIVLLLHTIYVVDFFVNEDWYTKTIDITHDHFGFMLAWGDTTFLPFFYTLQVQYLARYPQHLSTPYSLLSLTTGLVGYAIFRLANHEKDYVRSLNGNAIIWGRPAAYIRCHYRTSDGKNHASLLLASGWWGLCRHSNYMGDLIMAFAMCAACGVRHVLPWSYFFYMCVLLGHRVGRDEAKCRVKYGRKWVEYCERVPWRLMPGIW